MQTFLAFNENLMVKLGLKVKGKLCSQSQTENMENDGFSIMTSMYKGVKEKKI